MDNDSKLIFENYLNHLKTKNNVLNEAVMAAPLLSLIGPILQALFGVSTIGGLYLLFKDSMTQPEAENAEGMIQQVQSISPEGEYESEIGKIQNLAESMISSENASVQALGSVIKNTIDSYVALEKDESITTVGELESKVDSILLEASDEISSIVYNVVKESSTSPAYSNADKARIKEGGNRILNEIEALTSGVQSGTYPVGRGARQGVIYDPQGNPIAFPDVSTSTGPTPPEPDDEDDFAKRKKEADAKKAEAKAKQEEAKAKISRAEASKKQAEAKLARNKGDTEAKAAQARADREIEAGKIQLEREKVALRKLQAETEAVELRTKAASEASKASTEAAKWRAKTDKLNYKQRVAEVKGPMWKRVIKWTVGISLLPLPLLLGYSVLKNTANRKSQSGKVAPTPTPAPSSTGSGQSTQPANAADAISQIDAIIQGR